MPETLRGRYVLEELIGSGGMADVHRATDTRLDRRVAVKVLRAGTADEADRARFTGEARTLAGLSHPELVTVLDAGVDAGPHDDHPFLVMELVEGRTLAETLVEGPLTLDEAATVGAAVARALGYAHERGVVHRDVKPGNVLVRHDGRVKLADFGIARLLGETVRHTATGTAIGTAAYLAPEQVRGEDVTTAVDVYSLGLVLLEALTGHRAYPGPPTEAAVARLQRDPEVPDHLPGSWTALLRSMTALDPACRPTAAHVAEVLSAPAPRPDTDEPDTEEPPATAVLTAPVATTQAVPAQDAPGPHAAPAPPHTGHTHDGGTHDGGTHDGGTHDGGTHDGDAHDGDAAPGAVRPAVPALDRAGDRLSRVPGQVGRQVAAWWRSLSPEHRGIGGAVLVLVLLLLVAGLAGGGRG